MKLPTIISLVAKLRPLTQADVWRLSEASGVPYSTLDKLRRGTTHDPRYSTVVALWRVL